METKYKRERSKQNNTQGTRGQAQGVWVSDKMREKRGEEEAKKVVSKEVSALGAQRRGGYLWYLGLENMWWSRQGLSRKTEKERKREGCLGEEK